MTRQDLAKAFRAMHLADAPTLLVLPNAWDAMSARIIEEAGAPAIATTSSGVSWSLGRPDNEGLTRTEMVDAVRRIAATVSVPVTADIESGYGRGSPADVAETVRSIIGAGAVGINLEDTPGDDRDTLLEPVLQGERIAASRAAALREGVEVFINARIDVFLRRIGPPGKWFDEAVRRAHHYEDEGADGVFFPGVSDAQTIERLTATIGAPVNIMVGPDSLTTAELHKLGVRRVSLGPVIPQAIMAHISLAAREVLFAGTYATLTDGMPFEAANALFARRR